MRLARSKAGVAGLGMTLATAGLAAFVMPAGASAAPSATLPNSFAQTNLIANKASYHAKLTDPNLTNAWGLAAGPTPIWVSDNNSGLASVYSGAAGAKTCTMRGMAGPSTTTKMDGRIRNAIGKSILMGACWASFCAR